MERCPTCKAELLSPSMSRDYLASLLAKLTLADLEVIAAMAKQFADKATNPREVA